MAETLTANYSWPKPDPGASPNTWGTTQNGTIDKIDAQVYTNQLGLVPIGSGAIWYTNTAPPNWLICDGRSLSTAAPYDKLFAVIGSQFNQSGDAAGTFRLPPMNNVFPYGGNLGAKGGAATVTLDTTMIPAHAHPITDVAHNHGVNQWYHDHGYSQTPHGHGISDPTHTHGTTPYGNGLWTHAGAGAVTGTYPGASMSNETIAYAGTGIQVVAQNANINFTGQTTNVSLIASGTNLSTTNNAGGGQPHPNMPPYFGVNFIIKFQ